MLLVVKTISPRLSGHQAALLLASLSVMRDALALAGGYESDRIFARLEAIAMPGEQDAKAGARPGSRAPLAARRGRRPIVEKLALAGRVALGRVDGSSGKDSEAAREADASISSDVALQALVIHGLLADAASDDGFELQTLDGGSLEGVIKDGIKAVERWLRDLLRDSGPQLLAGADAARARAEASRSILGAARASHGGAQARAKSSRRVTGVARPDHRLVAAGIMIIAVEGTHRALVAMRATEIEALAEATEAPDDEELSYQPPVTGQQAADNVREIGDDGETGEG